MLKKSTKAALKRTAIAGVAVVQFLFIQTPISVYAQSTDGAVSGGEPATTSTVESCPAVNGTKSPTGSSAHTYVFNPASCNWENQYYSWNPVTKLTTPRYDAGWVYNSETGNNEKTTWVYSPGINGFRAVISIQEPVIENTGPSSTNEVTNNPEQGNEATISNTGPDSTNTITNPESDSSISNTGPNSNNQTNAGTIDTTGPDSNNVIDADSNGSTEFNNNLDLNLNNSIESIALSGNAVNDFNTLGGSATSGDAEANANLLNMIQSAVGLNGVQPNFYSANIQGGLVGDIIIDPGMLAVANPASDCQTCSDDLTVNNSVDASIVNDVDLVAQSGIATIMNNTEAGDATTGDATAVANIVNMINSSIATGQSFIGVLNVDGDFEGDVLLADDVLDQLIAANVPTVDLCVTCGADELTINNQNTIGIDNQIEATAESGEAVVSNNTSAGNATSGDAATNVTVFNLTGTQFIGENALLVFVNVLGEWVGFITNAPENATAAALGSDSDVAALPQQGGESTTYNNDTNFSIENNINTTAITGDATVASNTQAGNATSGDAYSAVNTANFTNSSFGLNGWFGILFINVFGDWHGSFGTDTPFGDDIPLLPTGVETGTDMPLITPNKIASQEPQVRVFEISNNGTAQVTFTEQTLGAQSQNNQSPSSQSTTDSAASTASAESSSAANPLDDLASAVENINPDDTPYIIYASLAGIGLIFILFGERIVALVRR